MRQYNLGPKAADYSLPFLETQSILRDLAYDALNGPQQMREYMTANEAFCRLIELINDPDIGEVFKA